MARDAVAFRKPERERRPGVERALHVPGKRRTSVLAREVKRAEPVVKNRPHARHLAYAGTRVVRLDPTFGRPIHEARRHVALARAAVRAAQLGQIPLDALVGWPTPADVGTGSARVRAPALARTSLLLGGGPREVDRPVAERLGAQLLASPERVADRN